MVIGGGSGVGGTGDGCWQWPWLLVVVVVAAVVVLALEASARHRSCELDGWRSWKPSCARSARVGLLAPMLLPPSWIKLEGSCSSMPVRLAI